MQLYPTASPIKNRARPYYGGFPMQEMGMARHTAVYAMSGWLVPSPSIGVVEAVNYGEPDRSAKPTGPIDAGHSIIGARSGMLVPMSDQEMGASGLDARGRAGAPITILIPNTYEEADWP